MIDFVAPILPRKSFATRQIWLAARFTSASVVVAPKLIRIDPSTTGFEQPIASSVGDGFREPLAQAEPVEQATPAMSNAISKA